MKVALFSTFWFSFFLNLQQTFMPRYSTSLLYILSPWVVTSFAKPKLFVPLLWRFIRQCLPFITVLGTLQLNTVQVSVFKQFCKQSSYQIRGRQLSWYYFQLWDVTRRYPATLLYTLPLKHYLLRQYFYMYYQYIFLMCPLSLPHTSGGFAWSNTFPRFWSFPLWLQRTLVIRTLSQTNQRLQLMIRPRYELDVL